MSCSSAFSLDAAHRASGMLTTQHHITSLALSQTSRDWAGGPDTCLSQLGPGLQEHPREGAPSPPALAEHGLWKATG